MLALPAPLLHADDHAWLAQLRQQVDLPPRVERQPLWLGDVAVGSVEPGYLDGLPSAGHWQIQPQQRSAQHGWALLGEPLQALAGLADVLRAAGKAHAWRNEQLAVHDELTGERVATVERAVVRGLGIATRAVHLIGVAPDGRHWVQQRALTKSNDPGLWDTLMGGMVSASDDLPAALARETWEEAGLHVAALADLRYGGEAVFRRPTSDCAGTGYVVEVIDWFVATVPDSLVPENQDGEVQAFALMTPDEIWRHMRAGLFTAEAALIQVAAWRL